MTPAALAMLLDGYMSFLAEHATWTLGFALVLVVAVALVSFCSMLAKRSSSRQTSKELHAFKRLADGDVGDGEDAGSSDDEEPAAEVPMERERVGPAMGAVRTAMGMMTLARVSRRTSDANAPAVATSDASPSPSMLGGLMTMLHREEEETPSEASLYTPRGVTPLSRGIVKNRTSVFEADTGSGAGGSRLQTRRRGDSAGRGDRSGMVQAVRARLQGAASPRRRRVDDDLRATAPAPSQVYAVQYRNLAIAVPSDRASGVSGTVTPSLMSGQMTPIPPEANPIYAVQYRNLALALERADRGDQEQGSARSDREATPRAGTPRPQVEASPAAASDRQPQLLAFEEVPSGVAERNSSQRRSEQSRLRRLSLGINALHPPPLRADSDRAMMPCAHGGSSSRPGGRSNFRPLSSLPEEVEDSSRSSESTDHLLNSFSAARSYRCGRTPTSVRPLASLREYEVASYDA